MQTINKKDIPQELTVEIEKLSNLGFGIARVEGYVIFVEGACPGDRVRVRVGKKNKNFAQAKIIEIISPSPYRVEPFCPMQKVCGACQLQFIDYNYQLKLKKEIVEDTMHSISGNAVEIKDVIPSPQIRNYRHKIQYPVSETKNSKRILAGYYKPNSHEIVNIKYCPIQPEYCDSIIEFIRNASKDCGISGYDEKKHAGDLRHIVIRSSHYTNKNLVVLVVNSSKMFEKLKVLAHRIYTELENIQGVGVNYNPLKTNLILGEKTDILEGEGFIEEKLCDKVFKVGAKTFFQVNPSSADNIFGFVKKYISDKGYVNGYVPTKTIYLHSGIVLKGTLPHKYRIIRNGKYVWCESQDLQIGDIIPKRIGYYTNTEEPTLLPIEQKKITNNNMITTPEKMNPRLAFLLGAYYANGSTHHKGIRFNMNIVKNDDCNKLSECIKEIFNIRKHQIIYRWILYV